MLKNKLNLKRFILVLGDLAIFESALLLTLLIRYGGLDNWPQHALPFSLLALLWLAGFYVTGLYDLTIAGEVMRFFRTFLEGMIANLAVAMAFFYLIPVFGISPRTNLFLFFVLSLLLGYAWRLAFNRFLAERFSRGRVLFIGPTDEARRLHELFTRSSLGLELTAALSSTGISDPTLPIEWLDNVNLVDQVVADKKISSVVLGVRPDELPELKTALYRALFHPVVVLDRAEIEENTTGRIPLSYVSETWFLHHLHEAEKAWYETAKRIFDLLLAIPVGLITLVILPFAALAIKLSSPDGPIFFSQERVGKSGKTFRLWKFRSMVPDAEKDGPRFTADAKTDPRLFTVGRFMRATRLDELPQVWNVIRGDLSFIGPRPERPEFVAPLVERMPHYALRHLTKPGLTGWAQVKFLTPIASLDDNLTKLQYDLFYIKNRSFLLDFAILLKTVGVMVRRQGT